MISVYADLFTGVTITTDLKYFYGVQFLNIKSGSAKGASRTLICSMKGI